MRIFLRIILIMAIIGVVSGVGVYLYIFHKPHRNVAKETPAFILTASDFYNEFSADEDAGYAKFGNQVIQVSGEVVDISIEDNSAGLMLLDAMEGISCGFDSIGIVKQGEKLNSVSIGNEVTLKGQCDGFDMIMGIVLTRCYLIQVH